MPEPTDEPEDFFFLEELPPHGLLIRATGRLTSYNTDAFETLVIDAVARHPHLLLFDFSELYYIDSSGLRVLILAVKSLELQKGKMAIVTPGESVAEVLKMTCLDQIMRVFPTRNAALAAMMPG